MEPYHFYRFKIHLSNRFYQPLINRFFFIDRNISLCCIMIVFSYWDCVFNVLIIGFYFNHVFICAPIDYPCLIMSILTAIKEWKDDCKTKAASESVSRDTARLWNNAPTVIKEARTLNQAKTETKKYVRTLEI